MPRLAPLPIDAVPEIKEIFAQQQASGNYVPNSQLIMQRKPQLVKAIRQLGAAVFDPEGEVNIGSAGT